MAKKYYWIKLDEKFFRQKEIKALLKMDKGPIYAIIYLKMLTYALENGNKIHFDHILNTISEEVALCIDEEVEDIEFTLTYLEKVGLVKYTSEDELEFIQVDELTGKESDSAKRMRKSREVNVALDKDHEKVDCDVKNLKCDATKKECDAIEIFCDKNVTLEKEIDKDIDKELEKDRDKDVECANMYFDENLKNITAIYEENIGKIYPADREWFLDICEKIDWQLFKKAVVICIDKNKVNGGYLKGIINRWVNSSICTLKDYEASEVERAHMKSKLKNSNPKSKRGNTKVDKKILDEIKAMEEEMEA